MLTPDLCVGLIDLLPDRHSRLLLISKGGASQRRGREPAGRRAVRDLLSCSLSLAPQGRALGERSRSTAPWLGLEDTPVWTGGESSSSAAPTLCRCGRSGVPLPKHRDPAVPSPSLMVFAGLRSSLTRPLGVVGHQQEGDVARGLAKLG